MSSNNLPSIKSIDDLPDPNSVQPIMHINELPSPTGQASVEMPSQLESLLRGGAQGASLGFADELTGGAEAVGDVIGGDTSLSDFMDAYRKHRDESRANYKAAEEANPGTYLTGNIGGGLGAALLTGGAGAAVKGGATLGQLAAESAVLGGVAGLGGTQADLTQGEYGDAAKDVAIGTAIGGALPVALKGVGTAGSKTYELAKDLPLVGKPLKGLEMGLRGKGWLTSAGQKDITDTLRGHSADFTKEIASGLESLGEEASALENQALQSGVTIDIKAKALDTIDKLKNIKAKANSEEANKVVDAEIKRINDFIGGAEKKITSEKITDVPPQVLKEKTLSNFEKAQEQVKLNNKYYKQKGIAQEDYVEPIYGDAGELQGFSIEKKMSGTAEEPLPSMDYGKPKMIQPGKPEVTSPATQVTEPIETSIPNESQGVIPVSGGPGVPDVKSLKAGLATGEDKMLTKELYPAKSALGELRREAGRAADEAVPGMAANTEKFHNVYQALEAVGLDKDMMRSAAYDKKAQLELENTITKLMNKLDDTTISGADATASVNLAADYLSKVPNIDGEKVKALLPKIQQSVEDYKFMRKVQNLGLDLGLLSNVGAGVTNAVGQGINAISSKIPASVSTAMKKLGGANQTVQSIGRAYSENNSVSDPAKLSQEASYAPNDELVRRVSRNTSPQLKPAVDRLQQAIQSGDSITKNAALNVLLQTAEGRKLLKGD